MGKLSILDRIKEFVGIIAWKLFIWSLDITQEEYWSLIYEQEKAYKENKK